ncbi:hypothetical protein [Acetobacter orientalis]|uniref:Lipoprotein n=1 Tax=Acetobacter orientalis TaxID=146474 RepID=A0A2Z5ZML4_9PROT|nr:hypothetical protein [Acetobacter orientalis]BBC81327.1 hypothetical protein AcetOrient_orf04505 [Acetobacter orientalis]GAN67067.1 hypothetical protein Abor_037_013 [Acetobacter orientalis]GBR20672.1 hypothetical protein AA0481_2181 [Acetobacter orientalis NRIC 0481]GEL60515.1 hypothetical protein AOR02nite_03570 [Acetobacter orientalis]
MSLDLTRPHRFLPRFALYGLAALGLLTPLAGCSEEEDASLAFAPSCPLTHIPPEAADYYQYDGKATTFPHLVTRASILKLQGDCLAGGTKDLKTRIALRMVVTRGMAAHDGTITLPWFVAVLHGDKIVNKHIFHHTFQFPANLSSFTTDTHVITVDLPIVPKNIESDYRFEVGFQLTKEQLEYNQAHLKQPNFQAY